jgi:hypothetical protein
MLVLRLVCTIARHWTVAAGGHHVRCSQCGTIAGPFDGSPLWVSAIAQLAREYGETPRGSGAAAAAGTARSEPARCWPMTRSWPAGTGGSAGTAGVPRVLWRP